VNKEIADICNPCANRCQAILLESGGPSLTGAARQNIPDVTSGEALDRRGRELATLPESKGSSSELVTGYLDLKDQVAYLEMQVSRLKDVNTQLKEKTRRLQLEAEDAARESNLKLETLLSRANDAEAKLSSLENTTFNVVFSGEVADASNAAVTCLNWTLRKFTSVETAMQGVVLEDIPLIYNHYIKTKALKKGLKSDVKRSSQCLLELFKEASSLLRGYKSLVDPSVRKVLMIVSPESLEQKS